MDFRKWGGKAFKRSEQMKKKLCKKLFSLRRFYNLYEQHFLNLRPLLSITFTQGFQKSKKFSHLTLGSGGKKTVKRSEKHQYQNNPAQKGEIRTKTNFLLCGNFTLFISKNVQF